MEVRIKRVAIIILLVSTLLTNGLNIAHAQTASASKENGKFFATIPVVSTYSYGNPSNVSGFMGSTELDVTWWWLFDQPVYYNTLRWTIKDGVKVEIYGSLPIYLHRKDLRAYPDLMKRFDDLRPLKMEITFDVTLQQMAVPSKLGKFGTYFDRYSEFSYKKTVKDVELMIAKSGKNGENISAGSPIDDFRGFTDYAVKPDANTSKEDIEKRLYGTFINTGNIVFRNAHISKLELPNVEIKSIYKALMTRERGCGKYVDNPLAWTCKDKKKPKTQGKAEEQKDARSKPEPPQDSFWTNGGVSFEGETPKTTTDERPASTASSSFWSDGGRVESKPKSTSRQPQKKDDFWADGGATKPDSNDGFWQDGAKSKAQNDYEIKTINGKQGVISSSGRTLIPFRNWEVQSYSDGMAKVHISASHSIGSCTTPRSPSYRTYSYTVEARTAGYVDRSGDWVIPPEQVVSPSYSEQFQLVLTSTRSGTTYEEIQRGKERRKRRNREEQRAFDDCKADVQASRQQLYNSYKAKGFKVKSGDQ